MVRLRVQEQARRPRREDELGDAGGAAFSPPRYGVAVVDRIGPSGRPAGRASIQAKTIVGDAGDSYEREADRIADRVAGSWSTGQAPPLETSTAGAPSVQRLGECRDHGAAVTPEFERRLDGARGGGRPLPVETRVGMESRFGADFGAVRLHAGPTAERLAAQLGAHAFTSGADIFLGAGQGDTSSASGRHLLAHELTHVVQQGAAGRHGGASVRGGAGTPVIQRRLDEGAKERFTQQIALAKKATESAMVEDDPAREQLAVLLDATVDFALAARDGDEMDNGKVELISGMFEALQALAPLERGGGYVSLTKAENLEEHYIRTMEFVGGVANAYKHRSRDMKGGDLRGFKKGMNHIGGALLNIFTPMTLLSMHGALGAAQIQKMQMSRVLTTLTDDRNQSYALPLGHFRNGLDNLAGQTEERVADRVREALKKFLKKREAQADAMTVNQLTPRLDPSRPSPKHKNIYRALFGPQPRPRGPLRGDQGGDRG